MLKNGIVPLCEFTRVGCSGTFLRIYVHIRIGIIFKKYKEEFSAEPLITSSGVEIVKCIQHAQDLLCERISLEDVVYIPEAINLNVK